MTENNDDPPDSKKIYGISNNYITDQRGILYCDDTMDNIYGWNRRGSVQHMVMARICNRPSTGLSCW